MDKFREVIRSHPQCADYIRELTLSTVPCRQSADEQKRVERINDLIPLGKRISKNLRKFEIHFENVLESRSQLRLQNALPKFFRHANQIHVRFTQEQRCNLSDLVYYLGPETSVSDLRVEQQSDRPVLLYATGCSDFRLPTTIETLLLHGRFPVELISDRIHRLSSLRSLTVTNLLLEATYITPFADAVRAVAGKLSVLQIGARIAGPGTSHHARHQWKSEVSRILGACSCLSVLALYGSDVCNADTVRDIPTNHLKSLRMECDYRDKVEYDLSPYEDICSALVKLQKAAEHLDEIVIAHCFCVDSIDDKRVEDLLQANMLMGNATFKTAFPRVMRVPDEEELEEDDDTEGFSDAPSELDEGDHRYDVRGRCQ